MHNKVSVGDYELAYSFNGVEPVGEGPVIVLVHGAGGQMADWPMAWRGNAKGCLAKFPCYAIDLPGHGQSGGTSQRTVDDYAQAVAAFLEALDLNNVFLAGHSMGAGIALTLAVAGNPRLCAIAIVAGSSKLSVSPAILEGLQNNFEATVDNIVKYSWHRDTCDAFRQEGRKRLIEAGPEVVHDDFFACSNYDLSDRLDKVGIPVLVLAATADKMVPADKSEALAGKLKRASFVALDGCGHYLQIEQTEAAGQTFSDFLTKEIAR
ncbi:alpha/beta fold hydrolase [Hoeflea poritis]|uniref:Alpha/beta fold hydrolase n=1 Tax=Hoeflea poritis TaxID=2993659 RepID=A0ABT4VIA5_9HYPH|nr:alpha/beta fold hydrolase [Hoeflea poritis]MDA4844430.1 alpha/beta fold hydrolase [Hoeflea poritis]